MALSKILWGIVSLIVYGVLVIFSLPGVIVRAVGRWLGLSK